MDAIGLLAGVVLLYSGGEALVRGASALAARWGVQPLTIGLTVVALGTSTPELFASLVAAWRGSGDMALGNVVGSNIANVGLILGVAALIAPMRTHARFLRREVPFMLGVGAILLGLLWSSSVLGRVAGAALVALVPLYLFVLGRGGEEKDVEAEYEDGGGNRLGGSPVLPWLAILAGLVLLAGGAQLLIVAASAIARTLGVAELVIGLTVVAVGTSLPELFASIVAALRSKPDIALGNVVGSNILNVLVVLGATALVRPIPLPAQSEILLDAGVMMAFTVVLLPFLLTGMRLGRWEAGALLLAYGSYLAHLFSV